jgi:anthranilate phosphoribosyltransferase
VHPLSQVASGTPDENAATLKVLLTSGNAVPEGLTPILDFVLLNASALLVVAGIADDFQSGTQMAMKSIADGMAWHALQTFKQRNG